MIFTACGMAFAHGSNDVNAVGPVAAVVSTVQSGGVIGAEAIMPVGLGYWCCWHCYRTGHLWLACHPDHWTKDYRTDTESRIAAELAAASTVVLACHWITHINHSYARGRTWVSVWREGLRQCLYQQ